MSLGGADSREGAAAAAAALNVAANVPVNDFNLLDTRTFAQPSPFDGKVSSWPGWSFQFRSYTALLAGDMETGMLRAESLAAPVDLTGASAQEARLGRVLYRVLAMLLRGTATQYVRNTPTGNGWRKLVARFEPQEKALALQEFPQPL